MVALMRAQKRLGHDVSAIVPSRDGTIATELAIDGIACHVAPVAFLSLRGTMAKSRAIVAVVSLLRRLRPDVLHSHVLDTVVLGRVASWIADVPRHFGGNVSPISLESELLRPLEMGTVFADTTTIASCEHTRRLFQRHGVPPEKLDLIYYAVDQSRHDPALADGRRVRQELGIGANVPVIGKMAYFYPSANAALFPQWAGRDLKGHDVLVRAVPRVLKSFPEAKFVLVGRGFSARGDDTERDVRELTRQLGVNDSVIFTGERKDVPDTLAMFDVSVQCSLTDNLAGTVESLLMERPMVVSEIPGFADTVRHEQTGLAVPPDNPEALADAIVRLLRDPQLARRLGVSGRRLMLERFCLARAVADVERLLERTEVPPDRHFRTDRTIRRALAAPFRLVPIAVKVKRRQYAATISPRITSALRWIAPGRGRSAAPTPNP